MTLPDILIVEDEVLIADDIAELCKLKGHHIVGVALNAGQALNLLEEKRADLVLLDINLMDEINGFDIAERLESVFNIPYLFITSYSDEQTLEKVASLRPLGFIVKPFNKQQLLASIELAWQNYQNSQDVRLSEKLDQFDVQFTEREVDVLEQLMKGQNVQKISEELFLSKNTIKYHIKNIYEKLEVHSVVELFVKMTSIN